MPRPYLGPKLWLDHNRGSWTIIDGSKRVRTGIPRAEYTRALDAMNQYAGGTVPERPRGPSNPKKRPRRGVYVLGFGAYVKIGISVDVDGRMIALQTPEPVKLYGLVVGWLREERELHKRFAAYRLQGEWFRREGELAEWINGGCK